MDEFLEPTRENVDRFIGWLSLRHPEMWSDLWAEFEQWVEDKSKAKESDG